MMTTHVDQLSAGDVIEVKTIAAHGDDCMTVLVLLATEEFVILDPCDESTPFLLRTEELVDYRKFDAAAVLGIA